MTDALKVGPGTRINLHFRLSLDDGKEIDSTFDKGPASFVYGDGSLLPGVERKLLGLNAGETGSFEIAPEDAFGQPIRQTFSSLPVENSVWMCHWSPVWCCRLPMPNSRNYPVWSVKWKVSG